MKSDKTATPSPRRATVERIRQIARVYTYLPVAAPLGAIVLN